MEGYQERMVKEYRELLERIDALDNATDEAANLPEIVSDEHYRLMRVQYFAMCAYEGALRARIEDLGIDMDAVGATCVR